MPYRAGYEEDGLLKELGVTVQDLQPLAKECTQVREQVQDAGFLMVREGGRCVRGGGKNIAY